MECKCVIRFASESYGQLDGTISYLKDEFDLDRNYTFHYEEFSLEYNCKMYSVIRKNNMKIYFKEWFFDKYFSIDLARDEKINKILN